MLLGDFNMSLWRVVPELRSRGVHASLVAWYPWAAEVDGELRPYTDSMGIFTVREDCTARPALGPEVLFNKEALAELDVHHPDNGPGKPLELYLPKECTLLEKLNETFQHSNPYVPKDHPTAVAVGGEGKRGQGGGEGKGVEGKRFYMKQKPFSTAVATQYKGQVKNGSHFPLAAFTENQSRRSPEAIYRRRQSTNKNRQRRQDEQRWQEWSAGEAAHWAAGEAAHAAEAEEAEEAAVAASQRGDVVMVVAGGLTPVVQTADTYFNHHLRQHASSSQDQSGRRLRFSEMSVHPANRASEVAVHAGALTPVVQTPDTHGQPVRTPPGRRLRDDEVGVYPPFNRSWGGHSGGRSSGRSGAVAWGGRWQHNEWQHNEWQHNEWQHDEWPQ